MLTILHIILLQGFEDVTHGFARNSPKGPFFISIFGHPAREPLYLKKKVAQKSQLQPIIFVLRQHIMDWNPKKCIKFHVKNSLCQGTSGFWGFQKAILKWWCSRHHKKPLSSWTHPGFRARSEAILALISPLPKLIIILASMARSEWVGHRRTIGVSESIESCIMLYGCFQK